MDGNVEAAKTKSDMISVGSKSLGAWKNPFSFMIGLTEVQVDWSDERLEVTQGNTRITVKGARVIVEPVNSIAQKDLPRS